jgi:hypothetical protein
MARYETNQPPSELSDGYFNLLLKHLVLFILSWVGGWGILTILLVRRPDHHSAIALFINHHLGLISIFIALTIVGIFIYRAFQKYRLGLITDIEFDDIHGQLNFSVINTITGKTTHKNIAYTNLQIREYHVDDKLLGPQRIYEIYEGSTLRNRWNIELTAWTRHPEIDEIVAKLHTLTM